MNHFVEVYVKPKKLLIIRSAYQKIPIEDAHEIVLKIYQGVTLTRQVIVDTKEEVMEPVRKIQIRGEGDFLFLVPDINEVKIQAGMIKKRRWVLVFDSIQ
ncbi:MAG: hypothetical protein MK212_19915 [Saprospiraceae bacterium]|nr:hypothetical protein [Saprospiraceae bacterium]